MNRTVLYTITMVVMVAFIWPITVFGDDLILISEGKVPGTPFEALQQQIDDLRQQIDDLTTGTVKAYTNSSSLTIPPSVEMDAISLSLPRGDFIMTITMAATFFHDGVYDINYHTYLECTFVDGDGILVTGYGFGGGVAGHASLASTIPINLEDPTDMTLKCIHNCGVDCSDHLSINSVVWTAIEVDELDDQVAVE